MKKLLIIFFFILLVLSNIATVILAFSFWNSNKTLQNSNSDLEAKLQPFTDSGLDPKSDEFKNYVLANQVRKLANINDTEPPVIAIVSDIDKLRNANSIQKEIYKDAQNGDYVLGFVSKMVIYRKQDNKIIYMGDSPKLTQDKEQADVITQLKAQAKSININLTDSNPQISTITDASLLNTTFYKNAKLGDIVAFFAKDGIVIVYRTTTEQIIAKGHYYINVTPF